MRVDVKGMEIIGISQTMIRGKEDHSEEAVQVQKEAGHSGGETIASLTMTGTMHHLLEKL